ncbi:MAG: 1-(5-phosphoribosyl)-5-[(5-phosphoribosylamino)methylideneamino]imidazole-4-carboxamide isomerase [Anaerolineales bacterium]
MTTFTIYPAIDLRAGKVVRLAQGDPARQTVYGNDPGETARRWRDAGAAWLHIVNLDGAFGDQDSANREALRAILEAVSPPVKVQLGGGLRTLADIETTLDLGVNRVILGTAAIENPDLVAEAIQKYGADKIGVGIDARDGRVRVRGWVRKTSVAPVSLGKNLRKRGLQTVVFTNIARDGVGSGVDVETTRQLAEATGLSVIASGGVASPDDVRQVRQAGLSGVIIGRALYEGQINLIDLL